jgi:hypothetical protein
VRVAPLEGLFTFKRRPVMRAQKSWFKMALMTLAAVGLMIGAFTLSAQADDQKEDYDDKIVILYNQFDEGRYVKVRDLELLCVPTHKDHYEGQKDDGSSDGQTDGGKDDYIYDHLACYKVKDYDYKGDDKQHDDKKY